MHSLVSRGPQLEILAKRFLRHEKASIFNQFLELLEIIAFPFSKIFSRFAGTHMSAFLFLSALVACSLAAQQLQCNFEMRQPSMPNVLSVAS